LVDICFFECVLVLGIYVLVLTSVLVLVCSVLLSCFPGGVLVVGFSLLNYQDDARSDKQKFLERLSKNVQIQNFMKICPVGAELFHAG